MKVRIGRNNFFLYALDIETHNDDESIALKETSMWLGCFIDDKSTMDDENSYFYTWDDLFVKLKRISYKKRSHKEGRGQHVLIYVYNLAFEYSFLLPYLIENGWTWGDDPEGEKQFNATTTKTCTSVWSINLHFDKDHYVISFRDLGKLYAGGIRQVAQSFGLETQKGDMDYKLNRRHGHIVTQAEKEYCFKDTRIVVEILQKNLERHDIDFFRSLSSSSYAITKMISSCYGIEKPYQKWREEYPFIIGDESVFLRHSVSGGLTQVLPKWQFKEITDEVCHIDANQMHPSSAYLNRFPYGEGEYGKGRPLNDDRIYCCHIRFSYNGVNIHNVIELIGIECIDDYDLYVWSFEIPYLYRCYRHAEIEYIDYYAFQCKNLPWRKFYKENWDKRMYAKDRGDKFEYMYRKLLNNGSYGKLIERPHLVEYHNIINDIGLEDSLVVEKQIEDEKDQFCAKYTYIPVGSCIPAYSRCTLIKIALLIGVENVIYTDTDSIFFIENEETMKRISMLNLEEELGGWKIEEHLKRSQFAVPKRYKATTDDDETYVKAGGFNFDFDKEAMDFMSVDIISSSWDVQTSFRVRGGTIIDVKRKEIGVPKKYSDIYHNNVTIEEGTESCPPIHSVPTKKGGEDD